MNSKISNLNLNGNFICLLPFFYSILIENSFTQIAGKSSIQFCPKFTERSAVNKTWVSVQFFLSTCCFALFAAQYLLSTNSLSFRSFVCSERKNTIYNTGERSGSEHSCHLERFMDHDLIVGIRPTSIHTKYIYLYWPVSINLTQRLTRFQGFWSSLFTIYSLLGRKNSVDKNNNL